MTVVNNPSAIQCWKDLVLKNQILLLFTAFSSRIPDSVLKYIIHYRNKESINYIVKEPVFMLAYYVTEVEKE